MPESNFSCSYLKAVNNEGDSTQTKVMFMSGEATHIDIVLAHLVCIVVLVQSS